MICLNEQSYEKLLDTNYPQPIALRKAQKFKKVDIYLVLLTKKGNILLEQTPQALIRLRRYLGMQSQLTMRAICSFFLAVAQQ